MLYRNIRKIDTGAWVDVLFTTAGDSFSVPAASHVAGMATALSLNANELEAVDGNSDARTGTLIDQPTMYGSQIWWTHLYQMKLWRLLRGQPSR